MNMDMDGKFHIHGNPDNNPPPPRPNPGLPCPRSSRDHLAGVLAVIGRDHLVLTKQSRRRRQRHRHHHYRQQQQQQQPSSSSPDVAVRTTPSVRSSAVLSQLVILTTLGRSVGNPVLSS